MTIRFGVFTCVAAVLIATGHPTRAQDTCTVSGRIFRPDGTPAANEIVTVVKIEQNGVVVASTPTNYVSDSNGSIAFGVPRNSETWVQANNVSGLNVLGGVPLSIPDAPTAAFETLWHLTDGVLSFNGRTGDVTLTGSDVTSALGYSPVSPNAIVATMNASAESLTISDSLLSSNVPRLSAPNAFQASISAPSMYGGNLEGSTLNFAGSSSLTTTSGHIILNGDGQGNVLVGTRATQSGAVLDSIARLTVTGASTAGTTALRINGAPGATSSLDIYTPGGQDKALRIITPDTGAFFQPKTYINNAGAYYTDAWMVISGHTTGSDAAGYSITHPSSDPFMLGIWSDVTGPALQVRGGGYLFSGLSNNGLYTFSIEDGGQLRWGNSTRAGMDTTLYRNGVNTLKTDGTFQVGGDFLAGNRRERSLTRAIPSAVNGTVDIGSFSFVNGSQALSLSVSVPSNGFSVTKTYTLPVQWNQAPANEWTLAAPSGSTGPYLGNEFDLDVKVSGSTVSLRLRRSASTGPSGTAYIVIQEDGSNVSTIFAPSSSVGSSAPPAQMFRGYAISDSQLSANIARLNASAPQMGNLWIQSTTPSTIGAIVRTASNQSANAQEWQNSSGQTLAAITPLGDFSVPATAPGKAPFIAAYRSIPNGNGANDFNPVSAIGYNQFPNGSKVQANENALSWVIEGDYNDGTPNHKMEAYLQYRSASGAATVRPLFFQLDRTTDQITSAVIRGPVAIESSTGQAAAQFLPGNAFVAAVSGGDSTLWVNSSLGRTTHLNLGYNGNNSYLSITPDSAAGRVGVNGRGILSMYHSPAGSPGASIAVGADDSSAVGVFAVGASATSVKGLAVRGKSGQTGNLQEWQNGAGAALTVVSPNGSLAVGSAAPVADAALDLNGGNDKGLRVRPRSTPGAPNNGTWSAGTMIVDSTGKLYICTDSGTPGTWQKIGSQ